jgi:diacylglycerol kinase family enzyme
MEIKCDRTFVINVDGEALYAQEIVFKLVPKGVNFIFPEKMVIECI